MSRRIEVQKKAESGAPVKIVAPDDEFKVVSDIPVDSPFKLGIFGSRSV